MRERRTYKRHQHVIDALDREVDRQRSSVARRGAAMLTRGGVLLAAAGVTLSIEVNSSSSGAFHIAAIALAAFAAALGAMAVIPRSGPENDVRELEKELWSMGPQEATHVLLHRKHEILRSDEKILNQRSKYWLAGCASFVLSLVALVLSTLFG